MTDVSTTLMLLLLMVVHHVPSVAIWVLPYFTFSYKKKKKKMKSISRSMKWTDVDGDTHVKEQ